VNLFDSESWELGVGKMKRDIIATAAEFFGAKGETQRETLERILAEDIRWKIPIGAIESRAGTHQGKALVVDMMCSSVQDTFKPGSQQSKVLMVMSNENTVVNEIELKAETLDSRQYHNFYVFIFEFNEAGEICELREYVDTHIARQFFS
jgi:ketosteroid isomerase-like protein